MRQCSFSLAGHQRRSPRRLLPRGRRADSRNAASRAAGLQRGAVRGAGFPKGGGLVGGRARPSRKPFAGGAFCGGGESGSGRGKESASPRALRWTSFRVPLPPSVQFAAAHPVEGGERRPLPSCAAPPSVVGGERGGVERSGASRELEGRELQEGWVERDGDVERR